MKTDDSIYAILLESASVGIVLVDPDGRIIMANAKLLETFGYHSDQLIGREIEILLPESLRKAHVRYRRNYLAAPHNRPMGLGRDLSALKKDGEEIPVEISLSHVHTADGLIVMAIISDITERKRLEEAHAQALEQRIADLETTIRTYENLICPVPTPVSARQLGSSSLRESVPGTFTEMAGEYARMMEKALEQRIYKVEEDLSVSIDSLAAGLGFLKATPRDVVDLHGNVLHTIKKNTSPDRMRAYLEEGHFLLLELLGQLTTYYRNRAFTPWVNDRQRDKPLEGERDAR